jgi:prepilin-type N-terminal cleavage/methylation domain-containing protein
MKSSRNAFTLIELLIVVAIIAILAAIAVPNFLEAQTRAKVSRVFADFRSIATALEAYAVDNRNYVASHFENGGFIEPTTRRLRPLTTPVAYMTKVPGPSPFKAPGEDDYWATHFQYSTTEGLLHEGAGNGSYLNTIYRVAAGQQPIDPGITPLFADGPKWLIMERGPDTMFFFFWALGWAPAPAAQGWVNAAVFYDPTNGTVSEGDIVRSQMKSSFQ